MKKKNYMRKSNTAKKMIKSSQNDKNINFFTKSPHYNIV